MHDLNWRKWGDHETTNAPLMQFVILSLSRVLVEVAPLANTGRTVVAVNALQTVAARATNLIVITRWSL